MAPRRTGLVSQMYVRGAEVWIKLDLPDDKLPTDGHFILSSDAGNYQSMYALALAAAANRWPFTVRIQGPDDLVVTPAVAGKVSYVGVEWPS